MERRSLLKTVGGIGVTASAAGAGVLATSGSAAAAAEIGTFELEPASIETEDGTITDFKVKGQLTFEYDGLDEDVEWAVLSFQVLGPDGSPSVLNEGTDNGPNNRIYVSERDSMDTRAGRATWEFGPYDVLEKSNWEASDFEEPAEGETKETPVTFGAVLALRKQGGGDITPEEGDRQTSGDMTVRVTNEEAELDAGVAGSGTLDGPDQDPDE